MFQVSQHPSSGVLKTVSATSGIGHDTGTAISFQRGLVRVQLDATVCRHLFTAQSLYMFQVSQHPSSGVLKIVSATSGIGHDTGTAISFQRGLVRTSPDQATLEGNSCTSIMTYTRGRRYSF